MCRDRHDFFSCKFCVCKVCDQYHVLLCRRFWTFKQGFLERFVAWFSEHKAKAIWIFPKIHLFCRRHPSLTKHDAEHAKLYSGKKKQNKDLVATYLVKVFIGLSSFSWESKYLRIRVTSFHISGFQVWEIHQVAASREMWNSNIARFVTDVQCQSLSPFSCDGRVPGLSPPKSIGVGGCLLLQLPLPNPKTSILPKVLADVCYWWVRTNNPLLLSKVWRGLLEEGITMPIVPGKIRDSVFTLVCLITNECHDVNEEWGAWTQKGGE